MKIKFEPPVIIGALCEDEKDIPQGIFKSFAKLEPRVAFLPFQVERRHLRNTIACMRLMDIAGLVVCGRHRKDILRHLDHIEEAARRAGTVDAVVRRGRRFVGVNVMDRVFRLRNEANFKKKAPRHRQSKKSLMGLFCQTCVELLTSALGHLN